jgi:hypothetical protein
VNILTEYARKLVIEKLDEADKKVRQADDLLYSNNKNHDAWRLVRDAALILEDLKKGLNVPETDECDC